MQTANTQSVPSQGSPVTSQPLAGFPQVPKIPQSGNEDKNRLPDRKNLAIGFTLFLIAFALLVIVWIYWSNKQKTQSQPTPSPVAKIENLKTATGRITQIDRQSNTIRIESTVVGLSKTWDIVVTDKTTLAKFSDWQEAGKSESFVGGKSFDQIKESVKKLQFSEFKVGDRVYLTGYPEHDFAKDDQIVGPNVLLLES